MWFRLDAMVRVLLIFVLALTLACMVPFMGASDTASGHLHHSLSTSCATCLGPDAVSGVSFFLSLLGLLTLMLPVAPLLNFVGDQFHPPRGR